jgi:hypothetical protein
MINGMGVAVIGREKSRHFITRPLGKTSEPGRLGNLPTHDQDSMPSIVTGLKAANFCLF